MSNPQPNANTGDDDDASNGSDGNESFATFESAEESVTPTITSYIGAIDFTEEKERFYSASNGDIVEEDEDDEKTSSGVSLVSVDVPPPTTPSAVAPTPHTTPVPADVAAAPSSPAAEQLDNFLDSALNSLHELASEANEQVYEDESSVVSDIRSISAAQAAKVNNLVNNSNASEGNDDEGSVGESSPPSYKFTPVVRGKSDRIMRSYRPSTLQRFRGASLLAWRRKTPAIDEQQEGSPKGGDDKKVAKTEVSDDDDEEGGYSSNNVSSLANPSTHLFSVGSLLKDTYSFMYVYPIPSTPFLYGLILFLFQGLVYALLLSSLIDISNPGNMLHIPTTATTTMRIAQGCAIIIAVFNSVDVMVALNNLLRMPSRIVAMSGSGEDVGLLAEGHIARSNVSSAQRSADGGQSFAVGARFKFANALRLIEGCAAVTASFILIVRSDDIIEMFINFAALEFVVNLDNLAFALAEHGLISDRLQDAARFVSTLGFAYHDSLQDSNHRRVVSKRSRQDGSCNPGQLAALKGTFLTRLFKKPVRVMKMHPDGTRRTALFLMTATLFGCWGWILTSVNGTGTHLCKSIDVEFTHAHATVTSREEEEDGIKPFLATRSGNYVAMFTEDVDASAWDRIKGVFTGKKNLLFAYRKIDPKVGPSSDTFSAPTAARLPTEYVEFVFFDPILKRWIFTTCDPDTDLFDDDKRACAGPQVQSTETDMMDLTSLPPSSFHVTDELSGSMIMPATISCNECGHRTREEATSGLRTIASCGVSGGQCSAPNADLGDSRQCVCPTGQYGLFCADQRAADCPEIEVITLENVNEPPGAVKLSVGDTRTFTLLDHRQGVANSPIYARRYASLGYTDRIEWRGGTHWAITREQTSLKISNTIAIAEALPASTDGTSTAAADSGMAAQHAPAGLMFHAAKSAAWGVVPDFYRPLASYKFRCKAAPLTVQLA